MPMYTTPTTRQVLARETTPAIFRPSNQANLEPATPINFSATQDMMPGMGQVQSGNAMATGLAPQDEAAFTKQMQVIHRRRQKRQIEASSKAGQLRKQIQEVQARIERAQAAGQQPSEALTRKRSMLQAQLQWMGRMQQAEAAQAHGVGALMPYHRGARVIPSVFSPPTPNPEAFEPAGISHQRNRAKILAMQHNIQPVQAMSGLGELAAQPLVVGGSIIAALWVLNKMKGR